MRRSLVLTVPVLLACGGVGSWLGRDAPTESPAPTATAAAPDEPTVDSADTGLMVAPWPEPDGLPTTVEAAAPAPIKPGRADLRLGATILVADPAPCRAFGDAWVVGLADAGAALTITLLPHYETGAQPDRLEHTGWFAEVRGRHAGEPFDVARIPLPGGLDAARQPIVFDTSVGAVPFTGRVRCPTTGSHEDVPTVEALLAALTRTEVRPYSTFLSGSAKEHRAVSALARRGHVDAIVAAANARLGPGWRAFGSTWSFVDTHLAEVAIGPAVGPADVLRLARVDPAGHGLTTEDVIVWVDDWHGAYGVDVLRADTHGMRLRLQRPPVDTRLLAVEVRDLCPDAVAPGRDGLQALAVALGDDPTIHCWWD